MVDPLNAIPNQTNILDQIAEIESTLMADDDVWPEVEEVSTGIYVPVISEEDLAEDLYGVNNHDIEVNHSITDDVIQYTDPAGNTFEAPVVEEVVEVAPQRVKFAIDNTEEEPETSTEFDFDLNFEEDDDKPSPDFFL
jgi:hypothetical protein